MRLIKKSKRGTDMSQSRSRIPRRRALPAGSPDPFLLNMPTGALVAHYQALLEALEKTRAEHDTFYEAVALRCIARVEQELFSRDEC